MVSRNIRAAGLKSRTILIVIIFIVILVGFMFGFWNCFSHRKPSLRRAPNIVIILMDDFGYADAGCYGSTFYETPNIDKLAAQGIKFTDAYATSPVCSPTRASLLTGKYPVKTGITDWIPVKQFHRAIQTTDRFIPEPFSDHLALDETTFAESLKASGYKTMFAGKWHLGNSPQFWPEHQGFDINKGGCDAGSPNSSPPNKGHFSPYGNPRLENGPTDEYLTDRLTDDAIRFIRENREKPFLVYLANYAVHLPLQAKKPDIAYFKQKALSMGLTHEKVFAATHSNSSNKQRKERLIQSNAIYAAMIRNADQNIGRIMDALESHGLEDNTIILFTSDNGGLSNSEGSPTSNHPLRSGKGWLYEGGIRVPLIIRAPSIIPGATVSHTPVSSIDLFPTILDLAGVNRSPDTIGIDGVSLVPVMKSGAIPNRALFWHYPHYSTQGGFPGGAVRKGDYKLIQNFDTGTLELYNLQNDPAEKTDISEKNPVITRTMSALLGNWRKKTGAKMMKRNPSRQNP